MSAANTPTVARRVHVGKSVIKGLLSWDTSQLIRDNLFPQRLAEVVKTSATARRCHRVRSQYIEGNGFAGREVAARLIHHSGLRMDKALSVTAKNLSMFETVAFSVQYNALGEKVGFKPVPVEVVRLAEPDESGQITHAGICLYLDSVLFPARRKQSERIALYNPDPFVVQQQIVDAGGIHNYNGQLFYAFIDDIGDEYYHEPDFFACILDMQTEAKLSVYDSRTVDNGFNSAGVFSYMGSDVRDSNGNVTDALRDPNSIEYQIQNNLGEENAGGLIVYRATTKEELDSLKFTSFADPGLKDRYNSTRARVQENITRSFGVPNELANIRREGGMMATGDELRTASEYMTAQVNHYQRFVANTFHELLTGMPGGPVPDIALLTPENLNYFTGPADAAAAGSPTQAV